MSARTLGPPGNDAGPRVADDQGAEHVEAAAAKRPLLSSSLNRATVAAQERPRRDVESYLRTLIAMCEDPPLIGDLTADDLGTPRGTASIARAALAWLTEGQPEQIEMRLREEIEFNDKFTAWRLRAMSSDMSEALDWIAASYRPSWAELEARREYTPAVVGE